jgi:DNA-binding LacI/PurR family transcriptional regulator
MSETRQLRIAVLLDHIESDYHVDVVRGVVRAAHSARVKTLIVTGGWLGTDQEVVTRNFIYDLLAEARIDGIVIMAGSLSNACGLPRFLQWIQRLQRVPIVTVGLNIPENPSVYVDNEVGVFKVVSHLIEQHHHRTIAFVGSSTSSPEVVARRSAYVHALKSHGIEPDERLIVSARLGREDGAQSVAELLDKRHFSPATLNAIVAANDDTALGSIDELTRRGITVPSSIAVVGFDDAATARTASPPLTTVNQRVSDQTYAAARALIRRLEGGPQLTTLSIDSEPVIRVSCGCAAAFRNATVDSAPMSLTLARSCRLALVERRTTISAELARAAAGRFIGMAGWEARLLDALARDIATNDVTALLAEVETLARRHMATGFDVAACHDVLTVLRQQAVACSAVEPGSRPHIEDVFQEARMALARLGADFDKDHQRQLNRRLRFIVNACLALGGKGTVSNLASTLEEHLAQLGIKAYSILRFCNGCSAEATLEVLARRSLGIWLNPTTQLRGKDMGLDPVLEQEETMIISPLEFDQQPVGIATFAWGAYNPLHYEFLREVLSASIHCFGRRTQA